MVNGKTRCHPKPFRRCATIERLEDRTVLAGDGDPSSKPLDGDINSDDEVNFADFLTLRENFGTSAVSRSQGDLNKDGKVNFADFLILSTNFGRKKSDRLDINRDGTLSVEDAYAIRDAVLTNTEYDSALDLNMDCEIDRFDVKVVVDAVRAEHQPSPADLNIDGTVDFADFLIINDNFGKHVVGGWIDGDIDEDGMVSFSDFILLDPSPF